MVDADEFLKTATPRKKKSDIEPFYQELLKLKAKNCTLKVMKDFLNQNGVYVSEGAISKFIRRREGKNETKQNQKMEDAKLETPTNMGKLTAKELLKLTKNRD
jgi:hypothetical protein